MQRPNRFNKQILKYRRRLLRKGSTPQEKVMWQYLRSRQMCGVKFRRQYSVDYMILDFYCPKLKLAIELDGSHHLEVHNHKHDMFRDEYLMEEFGIQVLRIPNTDIEMDLVSVLRMIELVIDKLLETS